MPNLRINILFYIKYCKDYIEIKGIGLKWANELSLDYNIFVDYLNID